MRKRLRLALGLGLALGLAALAPAARAAEAKRPHVVLISIDGLVPEIILPSADGPRVPALAALRDAGSYADGVEGVYPSLTYPSHTAIATGCRPARHGIMSNTAFDPERGSPRWLGSAAEIRVPTLWDVAREAGLRTAALSWPVNVGARIDFLIPEGQPASSKPAWAEAARRMSTPGLVDEVLAVTGGDNPSGSGDMQGRDRFFAAAAAHLIKTRKPDLLLLHLVQGDAAHHAYGRGSAEAGRAFEAIDAHVAQVVGAIDEAGLRGETLIVVTGDHGFRRVHSAFQPNVVLREAGLLKTDAQDRIVEWRAAAHKSAIKLKDPADSATAARVEALFRGLADGPWRGVLRVLGRDAVRELGGDTDALLVLEPIDGYAFDDGFRQDAFLVASATRGQHGSLPTDPVMRTGFLASGAGIRPGLRIPLVRMIDVGPTLARALGLALPAAEGQPMPGLLAPVPAPVAR
jgi:predicted AlkP superfamily pyrophosphatase or phosphodiesterase